jgi:hypothetical protein
MSTHKQITRVEIYDGRKRGESGNVERVMGYILYIEIYETIIRMSLFVETMRNEQTNIN